MPSKSSTTSKVIRGVLSTGSKPHVLKNTPNAAARIPFTNDLPAKAAIIVNENRMIVENSGGPNLSATAAKGAANKMSMMSEKVSPKTDE